MNTVSAFLEAPSYVPREWLQHRGVRMAAAFDAAAREYRAAREQAVLVDRSDRGLLAVSGADRKSWLNNLVTNAVNTLEDERGVYAFAVNVKGRILFDLNILSLPGVLWLDLDVLALAAAAAHFDRHLFAEDVKIADLSGQYARLGCGGPQAAAVAERLGVPNLKTLPALASTPVEGGAGRLFRHDFAGLPGFELIIPRGEAPAWWNRLVQAGVPPVGVHTLAVLRVEAGIPWLGHDLDEQVLPPETGQADRGISYRKGCYLGQEIIERLRAHGTLNKRLVRLRLADGSGLAIPAPLRRDNIEVGRITSLVRHPIQAHWPGLGYLKSAVTGYADIVASDPPRAVTILSA